ncbi:hypothetical protein LTS18_003820 [Coniosporium uncinatum]|uniref:Uncharacterized protein n=1 Tax=Coniosporium uncinatum TaxID=93489 RepID=A0ACC3DZY2_9PEZI|nr:hypothetical protein LTS18_003820 [Coniosporium uncinatum]
MISFCGCLRPPQRSSFPAANKLVVIEDRLIQIIHSVLLCYTPRGRTPSPPPHYQYHIAGQTMMIELHHLSNSKMSRDQLRERLDNQVKLALYMRYLQDHGVGKGVEWRTIGWWARWRWMREYRRGEGDIILEPAMEAWLDLVVEAAVGIWFMRN